MRPDADRPVTPRSVKRKRKIRKMNSQRTRGLLGLCLLACACPAGADTVQFAIGKKTPTLDGVVTRAEYGAFVPYSYECDGTLAPEDMAWSDRSPECHFAWDDTCFYAAMVSDGSRLKTRIAERDGNVYEDDSVELYLSGNGLKTPLHQIIVNARGTICDLRDGKREWNAANVRVANGVKDGKWTVEIAVPWADVGFTPAGEQFAPHVNFCRNYHSGQAGSVKFIDLDENYCTTLGHGNYAQRDTQALVFLRETVSAPDFPALRVPGPGENARTQVVSLREPGDGKALVFWGSYPLRPREPLVFRSVTTDIPKLELLFMTENNLTEAGDYRIDLDFRDLKTDATSLLRLSGTAVRARGLAEQRFDVSRLPEGEYTLHYAFSGPDGRRLAEGYTYYGRYPAHPVWENCAAGAEDTVPPPWPAPTFRADGFDCFRRTVRLGGAGLVTSVVSAGRELLAAPVAVLVNGRPVPFRVTSFDPHVSYADYALAADGGDVAIRAKVRAEFDGYLWFDLVRAAGEIRSLAVEIPLRREYVAGHDDGSDVIEKLPLPKGRSGEWAFDPATRPFFWTGDGATGMMGGTEDLRGWNLTDRRRGYVLAVDGRAAKMTVNFVDAPTASGTPVAVGFYLNPTPVRPKNVALENFDPSKMCRWTGSVATFCDMKMPGGMDEEKIRRFERRQANGEKVFWYGGTAIASPYSPLWAWYGREWNFTGDPATVYLEMDPNDRAKRDAGGWIWGCLRDKSFFDWRLWSHCWFLNNPGYAVSNLYFDISFPKSCRNARHGCANGEYFFRGMREMHKRIYRELKRKNPDGAMLGHVRFTRTPADNFFDQGWCGEAYEIPVSKQHNYYGLLKPEAMQVHYASRANDMVVASSFQIYRTYQVYAPKLLPSYDPEAPESVRAILHCAAYFKIHNMLITIRPDEGRVVGNAWWPAESCAHFLGADRRYSAYYLPDCPVSVDAPDRLFLHGVWWNRGEAMLVVLNDTDGTVTKRLTLDAGKMALTARTGADIFGRGRVTLDGAGSFEVTLGPRETRFFRFAHAREEGK